VPPVQAGGAITISSTDPWKELPMAVQVPELWVDDNVLDTDGDDIGLAANRTLALLPPYLTKPIRFADAGPQQNWYTLRSTIEVINNQAHGFRTAQHLRGTYTGYPYDQNGGTILKWAGAPIDDPDNSRALRWDSPCGLIEGLQIFCDLGGLYAAITLDAPAEEALAGVLTHTTFKGLNIAAGAGSGAGPTPIEYGILMGEHAGANGEHFVWQQCQFSRCRTCVAIPGFSGQAKYLLFWRCGFIYANRGVTWGIASLTFQHCNFSHCDLALAGGGTYETIQIFGADSEWCRQLIRNGGGNLRIENSRFDVSGVDTLSDGVTPVPPPQPGDEYISGFNTISLESVQFQGSGKNFRIAPIGGGILTAKNCSFPNDNFLSDKGWVAFFENCTIQNTIAIPNGVYYAFGNMTPLTRASVDWVLAPRWGSGLPATFWPPASKVFRLHITDDDSRVDVFYRSDRAQQLLLTDRFGVWEVQTAKFVSGGGEAPPVTTSPGVDFAYTHMMPDGSESELTWFNIQNLSPADQTAPGTWTMVVPAALSGAIGRRIYRGSRTANGGAGEWGLVAEMDNTTEKLVDGRATPGNPPPAALKPIGKLRLGNYPEMPVLIEDGKLAIEVNGQPMWLKPEVS
jgi:hypothetical protein